MNRRALMVGGAAMALSSTIPASDIGAEIAHANSSGANAVEWFSLLRSMNYDRRKQYVAKLRQYADEHPETGHIGMMRRLADGVEEMNERGLFG